MGLWAASLPVGRAGFTPRPLLLPTSPFHDGQRQAWGQAWGQLFLSTLHSVSTLALWGLIGADTIFY